MNSDRKTILLVEDNPDDEVLALRALQKSDVPTNVVVARDGQEALDYLFSPGKNDSKNLSDLPELILLDLKMPKICGLAVLEKIRNDVRTKYLPVVILTSSKEERDLVACYDLGANSYIRKPLDFIEFADAVKKLSTYWLTLNERAGSQ